ncbi:type VI secretion system protein [Burkholderia sp. AU30198]|nr:type VI secretion system protein [Burkholderia sp. AU30198]
MNGALLTIELTALASADEQARIAEAAALRARLAELRQELGISFPVYLLVTKMDRLPGFPEYFGALTAESRAQAWGFTLPQSNGAIAKEGLRARCRDELTQLAGQLSSAVHTRLQDEDEARKNRRLILLPKEFSALIEPLVDLIERVFLDSRYDSTQLHSSLRGVYFTSAQQAGNAVVAERDTIVQRLAPKQWQGGSGT